VRLEDNSIIERTWKDLSLTEGQAQALMECRSKLKPASAKRLFTQMIDLGEFVFFSSKR